jgi:hypothetical protein
MSSDTEEKYERRRFNAFLQIRISSSTAYKSIKICLKIEKIELAIKINIYARGAAFSNSSMVTDYSNKSIQINQPTRCNSFSSLLLDVYVQLNMFRVFLLPSSGAQQLQ